ncbi:hypothetical protein WJX84_000763 [Apatococcus fuscideae]|uniref:Uncharacterized protein n=1 Tax=Apatococcus fuscideae TaxID=2026836 RepID=A0AAW1TG40_9CHLO
MHAAQVSAARAFIEEALQHQALSVSTQEGRDEGSCRRQMSVSIRQAAKLVGARQARYLLKHAGNERRVRNRQPRGTEAHYGGKHEQPQGCTRAGPEVQVTSTSLLATAGSYSFCMRSQTPRRPLPRPHKARTRLQDTRLSGSGACLPQSSPHDTGELAMECRSRRAIFKATGKSLAWAPCLRCLALTIY